MVLRGQKAAGKVIPADLSIASFAGPPCFLPASRLALDSGSIRLFLDGFIRQVRTPTPKNPSVSFDHSPTLVVSRSDPTVSEAEQCSTNIATERSHWHPNALWG